MICSPHADGTRIETHAQERQCVRDRENAQSKGAVIGASSFAVGTTLMIFGHHERNEWNNWNEKTKILKKEKSSVAFNFNLIPHGEGAVLSIFYAFN